MTSSNSVLNAYGLTTPGSWWNTTLEEVCAGESGLIQTGPFGSQLHAHDYRDEGVPVVMPKQLGDNMISTEGIARISDEDAERLSRHKLLEGDIVFSRRGDVTRRSYITKDEQGWLCGTGCMLIRPSHERLLNEFLALFFSLPQFKDYIVLNAVGATMPNLNTTILQNIPLFLPSLTTQCKIVSVIKAYDDLIENNTRRIAILEEMAQAIYREWFVNFRFPGHENVKLVDSPLGQIPEGWEVVRFTDIADILSGGTPRTSNQDYWNGDIPFFTPKDCTDGFFVLNTARSVTEEGVNNCSSANFPSRSIFITARGTVGKTVLTPRNMAMSQSCYAISPKKIPQETAFLILRSCVSELKARTHGAVFDTIIRDTFRHIEIALAPPELILNFQERVVPVFDELLLLYLKNENLRTTRDLLLPKLISGKLDVEDLDIDTGLPEEELEEAVV